MKPHLLLTYIYTYTVSLCLLSGCGGNPTLAPSDSPSAMAAGLTSQTPILPGSKGDRNGILPGSKGDRSHILALEVDVQLPNPDFTLMSAFDEPGAWQAKVDGLPIASSLSRSAKIGSDSVFTFSLKDVPLAESGVQEIVFVSPTGVIQTAGLVPALSPDLVRLPEVLGSETHAVWMIAGKYQKNRNQRLKDLSPDTLAQIRVQSEVSALAKTIKDFYRQTKGQTDPVSSAQIQTQSDKASKDVENKIKPQSSGGASTSPGASQGSGPPAGPPASSGPAPKSGQGNAGGSKAISGNAKVKA